MMHLNLAESCRLSGEPLENAETLFEVERCLFLAFTRKVRISGGSDFAAPRRSGEGKRICAVGPCF